VLPNDPIIARDHRQFESGSLSGVPVSSIVRSMRGKESEMLSAKGLLPKSERPVVGENTTLYL